MAFVMQCWFLLLPNHYFPMNRYRNLSQFLELEVIFGAIPAISSRNSSLFKWNANEQNRKSITFRRKE